MDLKVKCDYCDGEISVDGAINILGDDYDMWFCNGKCMAWGLKALVEEVCS